MNKGMQPVSPVRQPPIDRVPRRELELMHDAAAQVLHCQSALAAEGRSVVSEVLSGSDSFEEWGHYPAGDIYDATTGAQYYYHAHAAGEREEGEHGHFHLFVRPPTAGLMLEPDGRFASAGVCGQNGPIAHLIAVSTDAYGRPFRLFTTNRWVTDETWYSAGDIVQLIDHFRISRSQPSVNLNIWLGALVRLFKPLIEHLLLERDRVIESHLAARDLTRKHEDLLEDRSLQNLSEARIDILEQIQEIERALGIDQESAPENRSLF